MRRRGRGSSRVPDALRRVGVTSREMDVLLQVAEGASDVPSARRVNDALLKIGRTLVPVLYAQEGRHRQDPALHIELLPDFSSAAAAVETVPAGVLRTEVRRAANRLLWALSDVEEVAQAADGSAR